MPHSPHKAGGTPASGHTSETHAREQPPTAPASPTQAKPAGAGCSTPPPLPHKGTPGSPMAPSPDEAEQRRHSRALWARQAIGIVKRKCTAIARTPPSGVAQPTAELAKPSPTGISARRRRLLPSSPEKADGRASLAPNGTERGAGEEARLQQLMAAADSEQSSLKLDAASRERLESALRSTRKYMSKAAPRNTLKMEDCNFKHWLAICAELGADPVRPSAHELAAQGSQYVELEQQFWAAALPAVLQRMEENWVRHPRGRPNPPKPESALAVLRGVRRVHNKRLGIDTVPLSRAVQVCDGY